MRNVVFAMGCLAFLIASAGCRGGGKPAGTATPAAPSTVPAASATAIVPAPTGPPISSTGEAGGGAPKLSVFATAIGQMATATMHTTAGASCTITYVVPGGAASTDPGLTPKAAGADGVVSWSWLVEGRPGQGRLTVVCGADHASVPITISP